MNEEELTKMSENQRARIKELEDENKKLTRERRNLTAAIEVVYNNLDYAIGESPSLVKNSDIANAFHVVKHFRVLIEKSEHNKKPDAKINPDVSAITANPELLSMCVQMKKLLGDALLNLPYPTTKILISKQDAEEMHERLRQIIRKARGEKDAGTSERM